MVNYQTILEEFQDHIRNSVGLAYAEVLKYYPDTQTVKVKILPEGIITTDLPAKTPYSGKNSGQIQPYFEGQQLLVGFVGDINNSVILGAFYNKKHPAPTYLQAQRQKYGKLTNGNSLDPLTDFLVKHEKTIQLFNKTHGYSINTPKKIGFIGKLVNFLSPNMNHIGNVNINMPTDVNEQIISIYGHLDDLNNKFAQLAALSDANKMQLEKMGKLVQFLTWAVKIIGLSPLKIINIYSLFPALAHNPFLKFFKGAMTDMRAIQLFNLLHLAPNIKSLGEKIKNKQYNSLKDEIRTITNSFNKGQDISNYINMLDFDIDALLSGDVKKIGPLVIQNMPQFTGSKSKTKVVINKISNFVRSAFYYYEIVKKQYNRTTNHAIFKNPNATNSNTFLDADKYLQTDDPNIMFGTTDFKKTKNVNSPISIFGPQGFLDQQEIEK